MSTEQPASPVTPSTTSTPSAHTAEPDISPPDSPLALRSEPQPSDTPYPSNNILPDLTPREARPYMPHAVGLGIVSPRTNISTLSQINRDPIVSSPPPPPPLVQRHNPFESPLQQASANVLSSPQHRSINPFEETGAAPPPSPSLAYVEASSANATLSPEPSSPGAQRPPSPGANGIGLRISIPPNHHPGNPFVHGVLSPPPDVTVTSSAQRGEPQMPTQCPSSALDLGDEMPLPRTGLSDMGLPEDFQEFDSEGLSALEKIYLFSRSRASFQRVFIAHALPGFLRSVQRGFIDANNQEGPPANEDQPQEGTTGPDVITPAEAVEYVLPLLNGLAMDEDETVKEALAAELVPVIWWFITHCKLVEDDPSILPVSPSSQPEYTDGQEQPTRISVQAFTPILGTLLLSPNGMVGGPARFAVIELLNRVKRADEKESNIYPHLLPEDDEGHMINREEDRGGTSEPLSCAEHSPGDEGKAEDSEEDEYSPLGLFGSAERRMFEREMVYQVVIGMGRLDLPEDGAYGLEEGTGEIADTTLVPTPHAVYGQAQVEADSYFPPMPGPAAQEVPSPEIEIETEVSTELPPLTVEETGSSSGPDFAALSSPPVLSPVPSPDVSPASDPSTPSLTSTSSSASSTTSEAVTPATPPTAQPMSPQLAHSFPLPPSPLLDGHEHGQHEAWPPNPRQSSLGILSPRLLTQNDLSPRLSSVRLPTSPPARPPSPMPLIPRPPTPSPPLAQPSPQSSLGNLPTNDGEIPAPQILSPVPAPPSANLPTSFDAIDEGPQINYEGVDEAEYDELELSEEASVGRLSSMSLMAAVTASGSISDDTKAAFVQEVLRVGRDPVYWVRREACFAVGALAKVVPQEVVESTLLPLFEELCCDSTWHVRHSALFALPAILSRLTPERRRTLALDVLLALAHDDVASVRAGVLEALAEVIHTFHGDETGTPDQLIRLFLGIREDDDPLKGKEKVLPHSPLPEPSPTMSWSEFMASVSSTPKEVDIYEDPSRPLVCAFNYPAVALTLGRDRWPELRQLYRNLSQNASFKVRRTLAASIGEMAKIIGPEHSKLDLVPVWWSSACSEEGEVRLKAMECLESFMGQLAQQDRAEVIRGLEGEIWGVLKGWRERESVMTRLGALVRMNGVEPEVLRRLLTKGLVDPVASVRETAISSLSSFISSWSSHPGLMEELWGDLHRLGTSSSYRQRMTFVACYEEIIHSNPSHPTFVSDIVLGILSELASDRIVDVRIRLARLLGVFQDKIQDFPDGVSRTILHLAEQLMYDTSHDVRAFAEPVARRWPSQARIKISSDIVKSTANFSRPPPLPAPPAPS